MRAVRITPDKRLAWVDLDGLSSKQEAVGGLIERLPLRWGGSLYINEEGKLEGLPFNSIATDLALHQGAIFPSDAIRGSVFVCGPGDGQGGDLSLSEKPDGSSRSILRLLRLIADEAGGRWQELSTVGDVLVCRLPLRLPDPEPRSQFLRWHADHVAYRRGYDAGFEAGEAFGRAKGATP